MGCLITLCVCLALSRILLNQIIYITVTHVQHKTVYLVRLMVIDLLKHHHHQEDERRQCLSTASILVLMFFFSIYFAYGAAQQRG